MLGSPISGTYHIGLRVYHSGVWRLGFWDSGVKGVGHMIIGIMVDASTSPQLIHVSYPFDS